ncbi:DUF4260 domain-containing protein [Aliihoeflea sp. PC F10.4]
MAGSVVGMPKALLRLEGFFVLLAAVAAYANLDASWWLFLLLFLAPDLSMSGYLAGPKTGATIYNAAHFCGLPLSLIVFGAVLGFPYALPAGLIWAAHIGFDRALGYGLKYGEGFGSTHLGPIGKSAGK